MHKNFTKQCETSQSFSAASEILGKCNLHLSFVTVFVRPTGALRIAPC